MIGELRNAAFRAAAAAMLALPTAVLAAEDCPTAKTGKDGFVIERSGSSVTEVFHVDDTLVRTVMRSGERVLLETTQFNGLLQLERIDTGRRTKLRPKDALAPIFPLKPGRQSTATFEVEETDRPASSATFVLDVKGKDALFIGPCRYDVFKVEVTETRANGRPRLETDYYSPDLKLIIGKEYKERDGRSNLIKYDRIYPIKR
jgi:hypothetical protein